ncbi:hypothetical protein OPV22_008463 [Ensete ventricosum]|uniref:DUF4408 domain-containing protein n=1 Tax=Ensete ventricosum TaxID=4639 RepID=A0AAV8R6N2_ENSVE|nr:hypothetical protein OPV22_008463 [Ensete ventricosum]
MDAIQAAKRRAVRRYRWLQRIGTLLRCLEASAALLLLSWSSARIPTGFLRHLTSVLLSSHFVFLLGNAIVLLLLADSGRQFPASPNSSSGDVYEEFLETRASRLSCPLPPPPVEVVYEDKAVCVEMRGEQRSRSERVDPRREASPGLRGDKTQVTEEEISADAEEFRRAVEAFIAKQTKFHLEERMAIVSAPAPLNCSVGSPEPTLFQQ